MIRIAPKPGQESVWDYPRPPRVEETSKLIRVELGGVVLAESRRAKRLLETSHPPVYYLPPEDVAMGYLSPSPRRSLCEWKGAAGYYTVRVGAREEANAAWFYPNPLPGFLALKNCVAFYPSRMDLCSVDGEPARPQPGGFYGGWITSAIVGPFKGEPGTEYW
jgi:uncharacterized protein (DUF427 family)